VIYDWIDDYRLFEDLPSAVMDTRKWLPERADFVFASSRHLYEKAYNLRPSKQLACSPMGLIWISRIFLGQTLE
jgi:hypothetical protein